MSAEPLRCPKCDGPMVQGFIVDHHAGGKRLVSTWVEGAPEKSRWWSGAAKVPADKCLRVGGFPKLLRPGRMPWHSRKSSLPGTGQQT